MAKQAKNITYRWYNDAAANARHKSLFFHAVVLTIALGVRPVHAQTPAGSPATRRAEEFDRLDRRARTLIATYSCAQSTAYARYAGAYGPVDSLGDTGMCIRRGGRALGVFLSPDSAFSKAERLSVYDIAARKRDTLAVDTTAILAEARAANDGLTRGFPPFQKAERRFAPFSMRSDGDSIEVWLVPPGVLLQQNPVSLGGEHGFIYSPDGRTLVREIDAFDKFRSLAILDTGAIELRSQENDLPLMSELVVLNMFHNLGRDVTLSTKTFVSRLVGKGSNSFWTHIPIGIQD